MKLIKPSYEILTNVDGEAILKEMEIAARTCYKSEDKIEYDDSGWNTPNTQSKAVSARKLIANLIKNGHEAMLEFGGNITVKFICDRGVSHELVRHRIASFAQESTRYCNYGKDDNVTFIIPEWFENRTQELLEVLRDSNDYGKTLSDEEWCEIEWYCVCSNAEESYLELLKKGWQPQKARSVLPNSLKTEINVSTNIREWRHIFKLRTAKVAHPQMRELMIPLLAEFKNRIPVLFDDIIVE